MLIETRRVRLRDFEKKDIRAFAIYRNNESWMKYQSYKNKSEEEYTKYLLGDKDERVGIQYAIADKETDALIGDVYLKREGNDFWLGYAIDPVCSGKGLMYEALCALVSHLREIQSVKIFAGIVPENIPSENLLKKLGFRLCRYDAENEENVYVLKLT